MHACLMGIPLFPFMPGIVQMRIKKKIKQAGATSKGRRVASEVLNLDSGERRGLKSMIRRGMVHQEEDGKMWISE